MTSRDTAGPRVPREGFIPLFWRLFIPNATVLAAACVVLIIEPANGRIPALVGGLFLMLTVNLLLMRRAVAPLSRLMAMMEQVDPLEPGRRLSVETAESEVTALTESFNRMLERLESERRESGHRALAAQEAERRRVAAELHDEIGQQLTAHLLQLDRLSRSATGGLAEQLEEATSAVKGTLEDVRTLAHRLRPEVLDELGLVPALRNLCDRIGSGTELVVHRSLPSSLWGLTDEQELVIYRVAQESLTNVVRHAGATTAHVTLRQEDGGVELRVSDDGVGMPTNAGEQAGGGLRGLRERALTIDAKLQVAPSDAGGTSVTLRVPSSEKA
jgi:two-component system, NarL family, sensor histidine kinase UhpB